MRRFAASLAAAAILLAVACGGSTFTGTIDCAGDPSPCRVGCDQTTSPTCQNGQWVCPEFNGPTCPADGGAMCAPAQVVCEDGCGHSWQPSCVNGAWVCPAIGPVCIPDAGNADAACPLVPIHCVGPCGQGSVDPLCVNGMWECPIIAGACPVEAGPPPPKPLACGSLTCNGNTQFCAESGGGAQPPDGGSNFTYSCDPIPAACTAAPTCACISANSGNTCPCSQGPDGFTLACLFP
jgi:hypothetical protein